MKNTQVSSSQEVTSDEMQPEYRFDYSKARPNRFAGRSQQDRLVVVLDPDIAQVFTTPESVNNVLRALIATMPKIPKRRVAAK
jgi:hypothetical protein